MLNLVLTKFNDKRELRLLLRYNSKILANYSSLYKVDEVYYVLLQSATELIFPVNLQIISIRQLGDAKLNPVEEYIFNWSKAEAFKDAEFIQFEHRTELKNKSRTFNFRGAEIRRTFEYLPDIFAILNYTADSFSDGGRYNNIDSALERIDEHLENGARIVDLGAESTRPGSDLGTSSSKAVATKINSEQEIKILQQILPHIIDLKRQQHFNLSVDTYHLETVTWLLDQYVDIINDVSGKLPYELVKLITTSNKFYVTMHSLTMPSQKNVVVDETTNPINYIYQWMENKIMNLNELGVDLQRVILDPGIGFGLTLAQSWYVVKHLEQFKNLPCEVMLGHSRKVFFSHIHNDVPQNRDLDTAIIARDNLRNVDYLRLHDLKIFNQIAEI